MQIGILTQPLSNNYGGILQNWALQQALKQMGHAPTTINIPYPHIDEKCDLPRLCWRFLKRLKGDKSIIFLMYRIDMKIADFLSAVLHKPVSQAVQHSACFIAVGIKPSLAVLTDKETERAEKAYRLICIKA